MILLTGAAGFIGSCLLSQLNKEGIKDFIIVDEFSNGLKNSNLSHKSFLRKIHRDQLFDWLKLHGNSLEFVFHLGARTDTTEKNRQIFDQLNLNYSKKIWRFCSERQIPLVYASSAATYGLGEHGFIDDSLIIKQLKPLNFYGISKNDFDKWAVQQVEKPPFWAGLKFFNVYGPNEYHKGRMASVIFHAFHQIQQTGEMKLFRSHHPNFKDGMQSRDFIYIKDVISVCSFFLSKKAESGLYNVGTGRARTFWDLAVHTFRAMHLFPLISFIDTPKDIRSTYQYFTEAKIEKLRNAGFKDEFYTLEQGIEEYVKYLKKKRNF